MAEYPLSALQQTREHAREHAEEALADALRVKEGAEAARAQAAERLAVFRREEGARRDREEARLASCSAATLQREARYRAQRREEEARLRAALERAGARLESAHAAVERARVSLAGASAEAEVVERHHERWVRSAQERTERAQEDELDDLAMRRR